MSLIPIQIILYILVLQEQGKKMVHPGAMQVPIWHLLCKESIQILPKYG